VTVVWTLGRFWTNLEFLAQSGLNLRQNSESRENPRRHVIVFAHESAGLLQSTNAFGTLR
jgi:hypothetical protein